MTNYAKQAKIILENIIYATVATSTKDGQPWNSPVRCVYDSDLNIYWFSDKEGQHSKNVRENDNVFIVVYDSTVPEGDGEGVYIQAKAHEITNPDEVVHACCVNKDADDDNSPDDFLGVAIRRAYKAVPQKVWVNDAEIKDGVFIRDFRVEVSLDELKASLT